MWLRIGAVFFVPPDGRPGASGRGTVTGSAVHTGRHCFKEKEKMSQERFQNVSFVLLGRLTVQVVRRGPVAHAGPCSPRGAPPGESPTFAENNQTSPV